MTWTDKELEQTIKDMLSFHEPMRYRAAKPCVMTELLDTTVMPHHTSFYECRRHAPAVEMGWPYTSRNAWCGEFRGKE